LGPNRIVNIGNLPISLANVRPVGKLSFGRTFQFFPCTRWTTDHQLRLDLCNNARIQVHDLKDFHTLDRVLDLDRGGQLAV
jgi:hypothetical protein